MADDGPQDERFLDLRDYEAALAYLRTCRGDTESATQMRGLLADEDSPASLSDWDDDEVLDTLAYRLERADLTLLRRYREYRSDELVIIPEQDEDEPVLAAAPARAASTWRSSWMKSSGRVFSMRCSLAGPDPLPSITASHPGL